MSRRTYQLLALALTLSGTSACDEAPAFGAGDVALRPGGFGSGGVLVNTSATGDWSVAQLDRNFGNELDGVTLTSIEINAGAKYENMVVTLEKVWVEQGELRGSWKWLEFKGAAFIGSKWNLKISGSPTPDRYMTIDQYTIDAEGHHRYVFMYPNDPNYGPHLFNLMMFGKESLEQQTDDKEKTDERPANSLAVCAPDVENGGSVEALVDIDVYVDMTTAEAKKVPDVLSINCLSGGVGKARKWNFWPHEVGIDAFVTAVRAVRADYCGDGGSYTKPGNQLYLEDRFGYHNFGNAAGNKTEAIWTSKGAACLGQPRDSVFDYWDVDCGGGPPQECKDSWTMGDFSDAFMWSKIP